MSAASASKIGIGLWEPRKFCNLESAPESHATTGGDPLESAGILE
jgi:hypothetical protein